METERLGAALKDAADLSVRYYAGLLKLSTDYLQSLASLVSVAGTGLSQPAAAPVPPSAGAAAVPPRPPLLLAGKAGEDAVAAFLIENTLASQVTARVAIQGMGAAAHAAAQPPVVSLAPGEQCVVQLRVRIDPAIEPGRDHVGELSVPELASRTIPFVVRRLADPPDAASTDRAAAS